MPLQVQPCLTEPPSALLIGGSKGLKIKWVWQLRSSMSNWSWREERKRSRDDYEIRDGMNYYKCVILLYICFTGPPRIKRGRWSDPGRRGSGGRGNVEISTEDKLESLVVRLGEKVTFHEYCVYI